MEFDKFIKGDNFTEEEKEFNAFMIDIGEHLSRNHASAFIGTGFSLNGRKITEDVPFIPTWNDLGEIFMKRLQMDEDDKKFQDPIRLSGEVSALYGESKLEEIIKESIPDNQYLPSDVHNVFLSLNWSDVFTTNYDTLLERAAQNIQKPRYTTVIKQEDLTRAPKPRIIKLHGSFPSQKPFIITEEHFRSYPKNYPIFVNTVQQSLIENVLVLFGFSGNDPNFIRWAGWIRDNLGNNVANRIYLVTVTSIPKSRLHLFFNQNINILNMSFLLAGKNLTVDQLFIQMFEYWKSFGNLGVNEVSEKKDGTNLSENLWNLLYDIDQELKSRKIEELLNEYIEHWKNDRKLCSKFPILTVRDRNIIYYRTRNCCFSNSLLKQLDNNDKSLEFLFELNWRWEKCFLPLYSSMIEAYKKVLGFDLEYQKINLIPFSNENKSKAFDLLIAILRASREDYDQNIYNITKQILESNLKSMTQEQINKFNYEKCLWMFFNLKYSDFKQAILNWNVSEDDTLFCIKKGALLAEIAEEGYAIDILQCQLELINNKLIETPEEDLYLYTYKSLVIVLLLWIQSSAQFVANDFSCKIKLSREELLNQKKELSEKGCDIEDFLSEFNSLDKIKRDRKDKKDFDLYKSYIEIAYKTNQTELLTSFSYLRFFEEIGFPFCIRNAYYDKKNFVKAVQNIMNNQPFWGFFSLIRSYDTKIVEEILDRESLLNFTIDEVNLIIIQILNCFYEMEADLLTGNEYFKKNYADRLGCTLPEILSRLCSKSTFEGKQKILDFILAIYNRDLYCKLTSPQKIIERFMHSLSEQDLIRFLPQMVLLPYPSLKEIDEMQINNPWLFIKTIPENRIYDLPPLIIETKTKERLFEYIDESKSEKEKIWYINILLMLFYWKVLTKQELRTLGIILWNLDKDESGFPKLDTFYKCAYFDFPCPKNINVENLFMKYTSTLHVPIIYPQNFLSYPNSRHWSKEFVLCKNNSIFSDEQCQKLLVEILQQWEIDSKVLEEKDHPYFNKKNMAIENLTLSSELVAKILEVKQNCFCDSSSILSSYVERIKELLLSYFDSKVDSLSGFVNLMQILPEIKSDVFNKIEYKLASSESQEVNESLNAITRIFKNKKISLKDKKIICKFLIDSIFYKSRGKLDNCIKILVSVINTNKRAIYVDYIPRIIECLASIREFLEFNSDIKINEYIMIKASCAELAFTLYHYYLKFNLEIPEEIISWQKICANLDEYIEVRNKWFEMPVG